MLLRHNKRWNNAICDNTDRSWENHAKWNISDRKWQEQIISLLCGKQQTKQTHRHRRHYGGRGRRWGETMGEKVKYMAMEGDETWRWTCNTNNRWWVIKLYPWTVYNGINQCQCHSIKFNFLKNTALSQEGLGRPSRWLEAVGNDHGIHVWQACARQEGPCLGGFL